MVTPWGESHTAHEVAPGIVAVTAAVHGGYRLDTSREAAVRVLFPDFEPLAGWPWFEQEDDSCVPVLVFAPEFSAERVRAAVLTARRMWPAALGPRRYDGVAAWIDGTAEGRACLARMVAFEVANADMWEAMPHVPSYTIAPDGRRRVLLRRLRDGIYRDAYMTRPERAFYSSEDLASYPA